ncbi:glycerophosphodiester phosphodiesterase [Cohnella panacarvi]|uniref:glycerophosphodiester phosphodiesterase n=1 Tax=Cohnella panacarvi TaxID=400776 RepID=UPI00047B19CF|nr:glycerophosphodiester phosphodiesterase family protein [Cohnella panacarvi]
MWQSVRKAIRRVIGLKTHKPGKELNAEERERLHPCVAHRGFSGQAPENTMAAFKLALSKPYVGWMELDVHLSRDDVPVVIHDSTLKRTTNGQGNVRDYTAEQLGLLDAGSWFHRSFADEGVPTLGQVLKLAAGRCKLNVELKGDDRADEETKRSLARRTVDAIKAEGMARDTVITSFRPELLKAVREYDASIKLGLIIDDSPADLTARVIGLGATTLSIGYTHMTTELLRRTAEAGIEVMVWTVNSRKDLAKLSRRNEPFQICTNYPDRWHAATREGEGH